MLSGSAVDLSSPVSKALRQWERTFTDMFAMAELLLHHAP